MRHVLMLLLSLGICLQSQASPWPLYRIVDRTNEERPLVIRGDTDMSTTILVDNNDSRPAVLLLGGSLKLGGARREPSGLQDRSEDPGLGAIFDGKYQPKLKITFSHHDFDRAFVAAMGTFKFDCPTMTADTCVSITANPDGSYGKDSVVNIGSMSGYRFGVLATGQQNLTVNIGEAVASLFGNDEGPGHTFYANESRISANGEFLRVKGVVLRIGTSRSVARAPGVRVDHVTAKFKGTSGVDYECFDDQNACGAFDQFGSSGIVRVNWSHPGGDAMNGVFAAFRSGGEASFGPPVGKFVVSGTFDCTQCPDQNVPSFRWETKMASFSEATLKGGGKPYIWDGTDISGLIRHEGVGFDNSRWAMSTSLVRTLTQGFDPLFRHPDNGHVEL